MFSGTFRILSVLMFYCYCTVNSGRVKRVIGGTEVPCGTQPRVVSVRNSSSLKHLCGATLLSPHFALTAAHCSEHSEDQYVIQLNNFCSPELVEAKVLEIIVHELYDEYSRAHDIALMRVSLPVDTGWLNDSVLPTSTFGLSGECTMYGYGYKERQVEEISDNLLAGQLKIVSLDDCMEKLGPFMCPKPDWGMLCAMGNGVDSCQGDSGGPLICDGLVEAVSSYGLGCGVPDRPGVYASVAAHLHWVRGIVDYN